MKNLLILSVLAAFFLTSCGGNSTEQSEEKTGSADSEKTCTYTYQNEYTTIEWTAFKFTEKTGVGGAFTKFNVTPGKQEGSINDILTGLSFSIPTNSVSTKDTSRDRKVYEHFFLSMVGGDDLTGRVSSISGDDEKGTVDFTVKMNGVQNMVTLDYVLSKNKLVLTGNLDVTNWKAQSSIDSLNTICNVLHTGSDGASKLWPDVDLKITSALKRNCE